MDKKESIARLSESMSKAECLQRKFVNDPVLEVFAKAYSDIMAFSIPNIIIKNDDISYIYEDKVHEALNDIINKREKYIKATYKQQPDKWRDDDKN